MNSATVFLWATLIFIFFKTLFDYQKYQLSAKYSNIILGIFSAMVFIFLYFNNIKLTEDEMVCGEKNIKVALIHTIIPFIFIYSLGIIILLVFPGWIRSFANTFGLSIVKMRGLGTTIQKWLGDKPTSNSNHEFNIMIERIYSDPDVLINELYIDDNIQFDTSNNIIHWPIFEKVHHNIKRSSQIDTPQTVEGTQSELNEVKRELVGYINMKTTIGQYIWGLLLSIITILVSRNSLLNESCYSGNTTEYDTKYKNYIKSKLG